MATKKYIAKSHIGITVSVGNNRYTHVSFSPVTRGGSVFYTDDEKLQKALESHPRYGKLFKLDPSCATPSKASYSVPAVQDPTQPASQAEAAGSPDIEPVNENAVSEETAGHESESEDAEQSSEAAPQLIQISVPSLDDAKDYLCDKFGISRTKIRSKVAIEKFAADNGIEFVGI